MREPSAEGVRELGMDVYLPDTARASGPWRQIARDLVTPAPASEWSGYVTVLRIQRYDQIRTFVTRGALLLVLCALLAFAPGTSWLTWILVVPAAVQTMLEIYLDFKLTPEAANPRIPATRVMVKIARSQFEHHLLNVTGVLGIVSVSAMLTSVCFFTSSGEPAWVKIVALVVASVWSSSAILGVLIDATNYSVNQKLPTWVRPLRTFAWLGALLGLLLFILASVLLGRWSPTMEPLAWCAALIPIGIGTKMRDYDRILRATGEMVPETMKEARRRMSQDFHDMLSLSRTLSRRVAQIDGVDPEIAILAADLAPQLSLVSEMIDEHAWIDQGKQVSLVGVAEKCAVDHSLELRADLQLVELTPFNYQLARQLITTLMNNAGQALTRQGSTDRVVVVSGAVLDGMIHLAIGDRLAPIPEFCPPGSTMRNLRERLAERSGTLTQIEVDCGKEVRAVWRAKRPPIRLGDLK